jgi:hypothetical protein
MDKIAELFTKLQDQYGPTVVDAARQQTMVNYEFQALCHIVISVTLTGGLISILGWLFASPPIFFLGFALIGGAGIAFLIGGLGLAKKVFGI